MRDKYFKMIEFIQRMYVEEDAAEKEEEVYSEF
jgi:hypothetical protein